jgi:adenylylsulfate kinase
MNGKLSTNTSEGYVWWFTGRPAAGKTTLALHVQRELAQRGIPTQLLDSDELRHILTPHATYSEQERDWFYSTLCYIAVLLASNGVNVLIAATAAKRQYREAARAQLAHFAEIYVETDLETCQQRDPKGLYARSATGEIAMLPGVGAAFEPPHAPEMRVDGGESPAVTAQLLADTWQQDARWHVDDALAADCGSADDAARIVGRNHPNYRRLAP